MPREYRGTPVRARSTAITASCRRHPTAPARALSGSLPIASDFTAFSVPLEYRMFGVKATGIKVMFSSSSMCGTIAQETASIVTDPDPPAAVSVGGRLWIDNITLAY